jgi:hypothetical protein
LHTEYLYSGCSPIPEIGYSGFLVGTLYSTINPFSSFRYARQPLLACPDNCFMG